MTTATASVASPSGGERTLASVDIEALRRSFPELVATDPDGEESVDFSGLVTALYSSLVELEGRLGEQKSRLAQLRAIKENYQRLTEQR